MNHNNHHSKQHSALQLARQGHSKQHLLTQLITCFRLQDSILDAAYVTEYYMRHWSGAHLKRVISQGEITCESMGITYSVVFRCRPSEAFKAEKVIISFRASMLGNFALVDVCQSSQGQAAS